MMMIIIIIIIINFIIKITVKYAKIPIAYENSYHLNFYGDFTGVPGGMDKTSGECSLC